MRIKLNKDKFTAIDGAFLVLKESPQSIAALKVIKTSLESCFPDSEFYIQVSDDSRTSTPDTFVMSVYPEISTIDKIISAVMENKDSKAIQKLWETNKKWKIEIDGKILHDTKINLTDKELTSLLLHEVGHIVASSSLPNRISLILKYEIAKTSVNNKMMLKDHIFRTIMALPILDACTSDGKRDKASVANEVKADEFAKKMGYSKELQSVLDKLIASNMYPNGNSINDKMKKTAQFSLQTLEDFQTRKENLAKKSLFSLKESTQSSYIENILNAYIKTVFEDPDDSLSLYDGKKLQVMQERADHDIENGYFTEFFMIGGKNLKKIDPAELDYIDVKINEIKSEDDKMMLISYIHSKLDIVEYYISILKSPKYAKKYNVPYSMDQLLALQKRLYVSRDLALKYKIPMRNKNILVAWPTGYEG